MSVTFVYVGKEVAVLSGRHFANGVHDEIRCVNDEGDESGQDGIRGISNSLDRSNRSTRSIQIVADVLSLPISLLAR